jgi:hypothetical protein
MQEGLVEEGYLYYRKAVMCGLSETPLFDMMRNGYKDGYITKEEYAFTLRENQKASDEMKSESRYNWKKVLIEQAKAEKARNL